jgi:uncharacterized protein YegP (UPF0339 family)
MLKIEIYKREDGKWAWRLKAANHEIIATDGGQGFENRDDCAASATLATGRLTRTEGIDVFTLDDEF